MFLMFNNLLRKNASIVAAGKIILFLFYFRQCGTKMFYLKYRPSKLEN